MTVGVKAQSRPGDVLTQNDASRFAEALVGKSDPAETPLPTPRQLEQKAQKLAALGSDSERTQVKLGDTPLDLEPPAGHCFLDESQPSDARLVGLLHSVFRGELRM